MKNLVVVLGAGASVDCASQFVRKTQNWTPPLVKELFDTQKEEYANILTSYPLAQAIAAEVRQATKDSVSLEKVLREQFRDTQNQYDRKKFLEVPIYLQHLLFEVSKQYTSHPDNYDFLISKASRLDKVLFISLNYDTLFDNRLSNPIENMNSYISKEKNWSLIKLHGSVNWGYEVTSGSQDLVNYATANTPLMAYRKIGLDLVLGKEVVFRDGKDLTKLRLDNKLYYPALSVPVGSDDEVICPVNHIESAKETLEEMGELNMLVIGYSGNDKEVIKLLSGTKSKLKKLRVVSGSIKGALRTTNLIAQEMKFQPNTGMAYGGKFNEFVQSGGLRDFIDTIC